MPLPKRGDQFVLEYLGHPGPHFQAPGGIHRQQRLVAGYLIAYGHLNTGHHTVKRCHHPGPVDIPFRGRQVSPGLGQFGLKALQAGGVFLDSPLPGADRQFGTGQGIGCRLKVFTGGQVAPHQRLNTLKLPPGIGNNGLLTFQGFLVVAVAHLFGAYLGIQVIHLGPGLGQCRADVRFVQRQQQIALFHAHPLRHRALRHSARQRGSDGLLVRRKHLAIQGQYRHLAARCNGLHLNTPAAFRGRNLRRFRTGGFQGNKNQYTDSQDDQG